MFTVLIGRMKNSEDSLTDEQIIDFDFFKGKNGNYYSTFLA